MLKLMAKSTAAELQKAAEKDGEEMAKSFEETMLGLEAFIKGGGKKADKKVEEKVKDKKELDDQEALAKSLQAAEEKKGKEKKEDKGKESAEDLAKSLDMSKDKDGDDLVELNGDEVMAEIKKSLAVMVAKAVVSVRDSIIEHLNSQMDETRESQLLMAKALHINGKILGEAMHEIVEIGGQPKGRKSALSVFEKAVSGNGGAENHDEKGIQLDGKKIMAKALELNKLGKITPTDVGIINHHVTGGLPIPSRYQEHFDLSQMTVTQ